VRRKLHQCIKMMQGAEELVLRGGQDPSRQEILHIILDFSDVKRAHAAWNLSKGWVRVLLCLLWQHDSRIESPPIESDYAT